MCGHYSTVIALQSIVLRGNDTASTAKAAEVIYYSTRSLLGVSPGYLYNALETEMTSKSPL